jgi:hypothetical protein
MFRGFFPMMHRMQGVAVCAVGVMGTLFVAAILVVFGRFVVMPGGVLMVFRCLGMMFCALFAHRWRVFKGIAAQRI